MSTVRLPAAAATELGRRYQARAAAEQQLVDYLGGVLDGLGIAREAFVSFDDELGCIDLADPTEDADPTEEAMTHG